MGYVRDFEPSPAGLAAARATLDLDVLSPWILTSLFLRAVKARVPPPAEGTPRAPRSVVVNVSSLAAVAPFASLGPYSATRAARDMVMRVVDEEERGEGGTSTLNWAPGPMDSELQRDIRCDPACHPPIRDFFTDMEAKGTWVAMDESAALCAKVVRTEAFASGQHLDFYDVAKAEAERAAEQ